MNMRIVGAGHARDEGATILQSRRQNIGGAARSYSVIVLNLMVLIQRVETSPVGYAVRTITPKGTHSVPYNFSCFSWTKKLINKEQL